LFYDNLSWFVGVEGLDSFGFSFEKPKKEVGI